MLMQPQGEKEPKGEADDGAAARLLNEDPLEWILKNEHVGNMLQVSLRSSAVCDESFERAVAQSTSEQTIVTGNFPKVVTHLHFRMYAIENYLTE